MVQGLEADLRCTHSSSLLVSTHYWVLTGMSTMPPSGRSKKLVPEFLEGIIHDQNVRHLPLSSPRSRMGNFAATVKKSVPNTSTSVNSCLGAGAEPP